MKYQSYYQLECFLNVSATNGFIEVKEVIRILQREKLKPVVKKSSLEEEIDNYKIAIQQLSISNEDLTNENIRLKEINDDLEQQIKENGLY